MNTAHWIQRTHLFRSDKYICSACGSVCAKPYKLCSVCGAAMKKTKAGPSWVDEAEEWSAILDDDW